MAEALTRTTVNGRPVVASVATGTLLADFIREHLGLTGTKVSCGMQVCGACTVFVDGLPTSSCAYLACDVDGRELVTIEGIASEDGHLSTVQRAFVDENAAQCGYCTSGFIMTATALLAENPHPTRAEIAHYLEGNICRCTGYLPIVDAILRAADAADGGQP